MGQNHVLDDLIAETMLQIDAFRRGNGFLLDGRGIAVKKSQSPAVRIGLSVAEEGSQKLVTIYFFGTVQAK